MALAREIARFVVSLDPETLPDRVVERLRCCVLNGFGIALGGLDTPFRPVAARAVLDTDGEIPGGATLLGDGRRTTIAGAALANAALFHGRAQEDTCGTVHLGAVALPLLTAMIEAGRYPLDRFLPALAAGYEVAGLLDSTYGRVTAAAGFRASILYGTIGAAAAAGRLMGLDEERMAAALANAAAFTGGTLRSFVDGTDEWRYQVGIAAQTGLRAAALARAGSVSAPQALEGKAGFIASFAGGECDTAALLEPLGREWAVERVTFKPYPVCAFNQTPVTAALALRDRLGGRRPASVTVRMNSYETGYPGMLESGPFDTVSGTLMSVPFCIATTLLYGIPDLRRMTDFTDPAVAALTGRIGVVTDPAVANLCTVIEAVMEDGSVVTQDQRMSAADYAYDRATVSAMIRRIGAEQRLDPVLYDRLEGFVDGLPGGDIGTAVALFQPGAAQAAA